MKANVTCQSEVCHPLILAIYEITTSVLNRDQGEVSFDVGLVIPGKTDSYEDGQNLCWPEKKTVYFRAPVGTHHIT